MILYQIISVPLFLRFIGSDLYGEWLILSSVSGYFTLSNLGFSIAAANQMSQEFSQKLNKEATITFNSSRVFAIITSSVVVVLLIIFISLPLDRYLNIQLLSIESIRYILVLLTLRIIISIQSGVFFSLLRAQQKFHMVQTFETILKLFEILIIAITLYLNANLLILSINLCSLSILSYIALSIYVKKISKVPFNLSESQRSTISKLLQPSLSSMSFNLSPLLINYGSNIIIGGMLGSSYVTLLVAVKTLANIIKQGVSMLQQSFLPELSFINENDKSNRQLILSILIWLTLIINIIGILTFALFGEYIFGLFTDHQLVFPTVLFSFFVLANIVSTLYQPLYTNLLSHNKHSDFSWIYLALNTIALIGIVGFFYMNYTSLIVFPLAFLIVELFAFIYLTRKAKEGEAISIESLKKAGKLIMVKVNPF
ncbi:MAG: hypothetical protein CMB80_27860 [Flammeovirgaceae bacterium]|nr:hypothetical protein [Flammeovirgaceae bacterium]